MADHSKSEYRSKTKLHRPSEIRTCSIFEPPPLLTSRKFTPFVKFVIVGDERGAEADREGTPRRDHQHQACVRSHELLR